MRKTEPGADRAAPTTPARPINPPQPRQGDHLRDPAQERLAHPAEAGADSRAAELQHRDGQAQPGRHHTDGDTPADRTPGGDGQETAHAQRENLFDPRDAGEFREHWHRLQGSFVDDPSHAVEEADKLVVEAIKTLAERKRSLEGWRNGGAETEDLRQAMRGYRAFLDRLLKV